MFYRVTASFRAHFHYCKARNLSVCCLIEVKEEKAYPESSRHPGKKSTDYQSYLPISWDLYEQSETTHEICLVYIHLYYYNVCPIWLWQHFIS
jgi:hypothetical protein